MQVQAIETRYKGYRFRSRLEARWAVFFDEVGIIWEYELEGYSLGDLGYYLPDFWLPQASFHAEVKPFSPEGVELQRLLYFDSHAPYPSFGLIFLFGPPTIWEKEEVERGVFINVPVEPSCTWHVCGRCGVRNNSNNILRAVNAARSARFEHGEYGAPSYATPNPPETRNK